jgi:hypothetical protein
MAGFNFQPPGGPAAGGPMMPFQLLSPELLAQMAQGAFHPPQGMGGGGMQMPGAGPRPTGMNLGGAVQGLGALAGAYIKNRGTGGAPGPGAQPGEDRATAPQWPPPVAGAATGGTAGGPLTMQDFWSGQYAPALGFTGGGSSGWGG